MENKNIKLYNLTTYSISAEELNDEDVLVYNEDITDENNNTYLNVENEIMKLNNIFKKYKYLHLRINK